MHIVQHKHIIYVTITELCSLWFLVQHFCKVSNSQADEIDSYSYQNSQINYDIITLDKIDIFPTNLQARNIMYDVFLLLNFEFFLQENILVLVIRRIFFRNKMLGQNWKFPQEVIKLSICPIYQRKAQYMSQHAL